MMTGPRWAVPLQRPNWGFGALQQVGLAPAVSNVGREGDQVGSETGSEDTGPTPGEAGQVEEQPW